MPSVGRKRTKNLRCPPGVFPRGDVWHWQPTSRREREERKAQGLKASVKLGPSGSKEAREKWAEVSGFRDSTVEAGLVAELLHLWERDGIHKQASGEPRAESTVDMYKLSIPVLEEKFGKCRYGKTAAEASKGQAIGTVDVQDFVANSPTPILANRHFAVLDNVFSFAIRKGKTTYNPCAEAIKNPSKARTREPLPWEVECLRTLASARMGLQMDFESITGWRVSDILRLLRAQLTADGVRVKQKKKGKRQLWEWTPELRRIVSEAESLSKATRFPASPLFPSNRGKVQSYKTFDTEWQDLKRKTNALLAGCEIPLAIADLHFHDLRSKAHDDAEDAGMEGHELLGNTKAVAHKHYSRREQKVRPLR